ncbi:MAG TPA: DNA polymerase III subunit chi [Pusillimonas sp.]|jgi:DNA polymerase-3 subunit chi|nr:DNA polymerase III subunit chi [Pusillimonas sp.]|tara:strand:+ start:58807 stop:59259 length:453 start_codon:yes stop_codon:yes gene_type:complete
MARVDFAFGAEDRLRTTCEVIRKHYQQQHPLLVYCSQTELLDRFDQFLWSFKPEAFIPHVDADDPLASSTPVLLTSRPPEPAMHAQSDTQPVWLLNLDTACPPNANQFNRILEIVSLQPEDIEPARQRWLHYKTDGHDLHAHDLSARKST